jgi:hypothetical protein
MKTKAFAAALLLLMTGASFAEDSCIRTGASQIILTDLASCKDGFVVFHQKDDWKYAIVDIGNEDDDMFVGCWRKDEIFVYVQFNGETKTGLVTEMMDDKFCPPPATRFGKRAE